VDKSSKIYEVNKRKWMLKAHKHRPIINTGNQRILPALLAARKLNFYAFMASI
jgi:hypothetical protein